MDIDTSTAATVLLGAIAISGGVSMTVLRMLYEGQLKANETEIQRAKAQVALRENALFEGSMALRVKETEIASLLKQIDELQKGAKPIEDPTVSLFQKLRTQLNDPAFNMWSFGEDNPGAFAAVEKKVHVLTVLNLKGGVGKTTLAMNYGAYLAREKKKRVLFIDMDYQGSLTNTFRRAWVAETQRDIPVHGFSRGAPGFWLHSGITPEQLIADSFDTHSVVPNSRLLEADYPLFDIENRTYLQWALRSSLDDVRLRLAKLIHTATVQHSIDAVVIDAPPRLSLGAINAMCASTHFVVPTVLDTLSMEPIKMLLAQVQQLFPEGILPEFAGVLPCQTFGKRLSAYEDRMRTSLVRSMTNINHVDKVFEAHVPNKAAISKIAGQRVGYISSAEVRDSMAAACEELFKRTLEKQRKHVPLSIVRAETAAVA